MENLEEICNSQNQIPAFQNHPAKRITKLINASTFITSNATNTYVVGENSLIFGDGMRLIRIERIKRIPSPKISEFSPTT